MLSHAAKGFLKSKLYNSINTGIWFACASVCTCCVCVRVSLCVLYHCVTTTYNTITQSSALPLEHSLMKRLAI